MIRVNLFHEVAGLWSVSLDPPVFSVHLFLCVEELSFSLGLCLVRISGCPMGRVSVCLSLVVLSSPYVSSLSHFVARTCRLDAPLPRSLRLCSFESLPGDLEEGSLMPSFSPFVLLWSVRSLQCLLRLRFLFLLVCLLVSFKERGVVFSTRSDFGCWLCP